MAIEIIKSRKPSRGMLRAAIFDFDGTISTLRCGWEQVMRPLMIEMIRGGKSDSALEQMVDEYIDQSTGIQTVYQMRWLAERVAEFRGPEAAKDEWWYKDEYNRRLMEQVKVRIASVKEGREDRLNYMIKGAEGFLKALRDAGLELYLASGTDHCDVVKEVAVLGLTGYFNLIKGAPERQASCSKEAVIRMIMKEKGLKGEELLLAGDGKVEIALGVENEAHTLGVATDEVHREGVNPVKRERLVKAGAEAIIGDFQDSAPVLEWLGLDGWRGRKTDVPDRNRHWRDKVCSCVGTGTGWNVTSPGKEEIPHSGL